LSFRSRATGPHPEQACLDRRDDQPDQLGARIEACRLVIGDKKINAATRAEASLRRALAYAQRAEQTGSNDDIDRAIADLAEGLRLDPNYAAQRYALQMRAGLRFHRGDYDAAAADYTALLGLEPNWTAGYSYRGIVFAAKGEPDRAIADFTEAIRLDPNAAAIYNNRALSYLQAGKLAEALADADHAVALEPNDAASYSARIVINRAAGNSAKVDSDLAKALSLDPSNEAIRNELALAEASQAGTNVAAGSYLMNIKSVPEAGGKCVSTPDGQFSEGMRVFIWDCNAPLAQTLSYDDQAQQLRFGGHCVQALGQGNPHDDIGVGTCNGSASQRWSMVPVKDNYQIVGAGNLCLNISNGVIADGTPLELSACVKDNAVQLWALYQASNAVAVSSSPVQASLSVQSIFERHGLIGTFAEDCAQDPSDSNQYIVHRVVDTNHVERDQMKSRTVRAYAALVDNADEVTANDLGMNMVITESANAQMKDWRMRLVTRIDGNRVRLMESGAVSGPYAGQKNIVAGKATNGRTETRWLTKCR
jgi:tetratricopeptide (TPR) repeat protein